MRMTLTCYQYESTSSAGQVPIVFMRPRDKQREADEAKQSFTHMCARALRRILSLGDLYEPFGM